MPKRKSVEKLPEDVRIELNARLIQNGFSDYDDLRAWLAEKGYRISHGAMGRHAKDFKDKYEAQMGDVYRSTAMASASGQASPDDAAALVGAASRLAMDSFLRILVDIRSVEEDDEYNHDDMIRRLTKISNGISDLGRVTIQHSKHAADVRRQLAAEAADRVEVAASRGGVSPEGIAALRAAIMEGL
jgi:hypothetical protein